MISNDAMPDGKGRRILFVVEAMGGGVREHVIQLSQGLLQRGWDVHLVVSLDRADGQFHKERPRLEAAGIRVYPLLMKRNPASPANFLAMFRVRRLLKRLRPDLVHTHSAIGGAVGRVATWMAGDIPVLYSPHGGSLHEKQAMHWIYAIIERVLAIHTSTIILVSEWLRARCAQVVRCAPEKMMVVPVGIDPYRFSTPDREQRRQDRAQLGIADEDVVFLCVALLRRIKGQDVLVRAFQRVHEHNPHARLILVGEGELHGELESLIQQLRLASCARLTGFVDDVMPYFGAADVYVHPSRGDAGPYSPLQAMASSLPVIATLVGALPEIVEDGHTGILVPPEDPSAMSLAMLSLVENAGERRRMGLAGRRRSIECFHLHDMILRTEKVYLHCLGLQEQQVVAAYASQ